MRTRTIPRTATTFRSTLALALALAFGCAAAASAQQEERFNRTLDVGERAEFSLSNISGDILVEGAPGGQIVIDAVKRLDDDADSGELSSVDIDVSQMGNRVRVETRHKRGSHGHRHGGGVSVSYRVKVPRGTEVDLQSVSGSVTLRGVEGEATAQSVSGEVSVSDTPNLSLAKSVSGDVDVARARSGREMEIESVSGNVTADGVEADELNVSSVSGDVSITGVSTKRASLESVSGEIRYTGRIASGGRYQFRSHSGDVVIAIGDEVGFQLEASTFSGEIQSELPLQTTSLDSRHRNVQGVVGDGSAFIEATTFSGDVEIRRR
jgi:hypothetical protein